MPKNILYKQIILLWLLSPIYVDAQLVGGNAFLKGNYIRLGLTSNAAFGSTVAAPPGFVLPGSDAKNTPLCNLGKIGFVADAGKDGWNIGTPPYIGEYFLPGTPEEGWAVSMNGIDYNNNRSPEFISANSTDYCQSGTQIPGSFSSFLDLPDKQVAEWEGIIDGLKIQKRITLPKEKLYFITEVKFINTTTSIIRDVYYMRNVDPDNEVVPTGSFITNNRIDFQNPFSQNKALVSARGDEYSSYLGLGTIDCRAKVCIKGGLGFLVNRSPLDVYNGVPPRQSALNDRSLVDAAIAISFRLGDILPGDSVRFAFAYILSQADLGEGLSKTAPQFEINGSTVYTGGATINCTGTTLPINIYNGDDYTWTWSPSTGLNTTTGPSVIYTTQPAPITYTVTGFNPICSDAKLTLTVYPPNTPIAEFKTDSLCGNKIVTFTNLSPDAAYLWDFGDGQTSTETSPAHTYAANGDYTVRLTLANPTLPVCGNVLTTTHVVHVKDAPVPFIGYANDACVGTPFTLQGNATVPGGSISSHKWTLPGNIIYTTRNIAPVFPQPGTYDILYEATSDQSCKASVTKTITVESIPSASFVVGNGCAGEPLSVKNESTNISGAITRYNWNRGIGQAPVTGLTPSVIYSVPGNYILELTASTTNGCAAIVSKPVAIESVPVADFIYSPACLNQLTQFTNKSSNGNIIAYQWNFDNGSISTITNPSATFLTERNYNVSLKAITANGCESLKEKVIIVSKVKPDAGKDKIVFKGAPFRLEAKGGISYVWTPAVYLNDNKIAKPTGELQQEQLFTVEVTDVRGCKGIDNIKVAVFDHDDIYVPTSFTPNSDGKNDIFRVIAPPDVVYLFEVYNRWGQKVFGTSNQQNGWDGRQQGIQQPAGVYVWYLKAKTRDGVKVEKKGTVTLIW